MADGGEKGEPIPIRFNPQPGEFKPVLIKNTSPRYDGYLIGKERKVIRSATYSDKNECIVYHYNVTSPRNMDGTYVVLQFIESTAYFFVNRKGDLRLLEAEIWKTQAEGITTTSDPRVFLTIPNKSCKSDVMFSSCVASKQQPSNKTMARVITLFKNPEKPAVVSAEGNGEAQEAQLFRLYHIPKTDHPVDDDHHEAWRRLLLLTVEDSGEESD